MKTKPTTTLDGKKKQKNQKKRKRTLFVGVERELKLGLRRRHAGIMRRRRVVQQCVEEGERRPLHKHDVVDRAGTDRMPHPVDDSVLNVAAPSLGDRPGDKERESREQPLDRARDAETGQADREG